ncbi:glycosyltransferase [Candidatus Woesearchaeota archaeon]|nr:glycosyltransferase [Candidatus Woesearchaeota archaeon]
MKVLHLITGLGIGGAENMLLKVLPNLKNENVVCSLTNNNEIGKKIEKKGVKVYYLGLNHLNLLGTILRFRKVVKKERPDILNTYLIHSNLFGRIFGRLFGVKKIICSVRNKHIDKPFLNFLDRMSSFIVDLYTPNSKAVGNYLVKKQKIKTKKIKVIQNGIEINKFNVKVNKQKKKKELRIENRLVIGCVAKLRKQKGHEYLLKAIPLVIKKNPKCIFLIIGKGKEERTLKNLVKSLNIQDKVSFLGAQLDTAELLKIMDLFVLPTLYEGMSNAILEAMAAKCSIITTDIAENRELIKDGKEGLLVKQKNHVDLANAINYLIDNKKIRQKFGENAYKKVKEDFSIKKTIEKYKGLYK